jgi:hypothetical protein
VRSSVHDETHPRFGEVVVSQFLRLRSSTRGLRRDCLNVDGARDGQVAWSAASIARPKASTRRRGSPRLTRTAAVISVGSSTSGLACAVTRSTARSAYRSRTR